MIEILLAIVVLGIAINSTVECIHHALIFERMRAYFEAKDGLLNDIISCPYCLSYHVGWFLSLFMMTFLPWWSWIIVWLASTRVAQLINDREAAVSRTPKTNGYSVSIEKTDSK